MTVQTTVSTVHPPRLSQQQKALLLWLLERDETQDFLIDGDDSKYMPYKPTLIPWSSREFLGDEPTNSQSSALSRSLSLLEKHKMVELRRVKGKQARTSHLQLTRKGRIFAEALSKGYTSASSKKESKTLSFTADSMARWSMLDVGILLMKRELSRIDQALEASAVDYRGFSIPRIPAGGTCETREQIEKSRTNIERALKSAEDERYEGVRKFKEVLQGIDMGVIADNTNL